MQILKNSILSDPMYVMRMKYGLHRLLSPAGSAVPRGPCCKPAGWVLQQVLVRIQIVKSKVYHGISIPVSAPLLFLLLNVLNSGNATLPGVEMGPSCSDPMSLRNCDGLDPKFSSSPHPR